ncbi:DUF4148 domain-containing protein [Roseateles amylovorans]|uniref:DUF4148 domain-containing protein n=1 Tax=Roseateles amylovorans TaxID=2978473 RepID=A0ABY6AWV5_9BURK|nr:DUF4148 domain-containing protein [Roseateles amylovorans]UXH77656.1 DUF4148 domain-containing protein [Roseateles amylovorans]
MNTLNLTLSKITLVAAAVLSASAAFAAEPVEKTREQVIAELQQARVSGEVASLSAEQAGVGGLNNGLTAPTSAQIAAKKTPETVAVKKGNASELANANK